MTASQSTPLSLVHEIGSQVRLSAADVELFRYVYRPTEAQFESPRPYVHPVRTPGGRLVTVFRPHDHVWHKGITLSLPNFGPDNFWGGPTYTRAVGGYSNLGNNGSMDHAEVLAAEVEGERATFTHRLVWHREPRAGEAEGSAVVEEVRTLRAVLAPAAEAWVLGWTSELTNISGETIAIGSPTTEGRENAGYGGVFWRGPRSFTGGYMVGANGVEGEELRGTEAPWAGFSGKHDEVDGASTVVFVDFGHGGALPTKWFARSDPFACLNPAPFFDTVHEFAPGATITLDHAVAIADGPSDAERMARLADAASAALAPAGAPAGGIR
ncbi:DUF6807 domain-containing protein [Gryllotalpicola ginsengisoli]|uniref:DUF6807 domain-containing protein n=1 Tax=Gryllotalpicola ginsengisoli TaxID=444608 RepID=UPI0003B78EA8|nr:PmoA family protein [Gryllotalpicola ginsengisoli]